MEVRILSRVPILGGIVMITRIGRTYCKDGILVSTICIRILNYVEYETALITKDGEHNIVAKYDTRVEAMMGHHTHVKEHGGMDRLVQFLNK